MANVKFIAVSRGLRGIVDYVTNREKTVEQLISGVNCVARTAVPEFEAVKKQFRKTEGRGYYHIVQAFAPDDPLDFATAHELGVKLAEHFEGYQCIVVTHMNTAHIHNHIIMNSVNFETGMKFHQSAREMQQVKDYCSQLCREYGLSVTESKADPFRIPTWKRRLTDHIKEAMEQSRTQQEFVVYLNYIGNHIVPELGNTPLEKLTTIQIQKFYNDLQKSGRIQRYTHIKLKDKGLSTRVVRGIHTLLNNCLEQAVAERLILANPAKGCRLPKLEKREMKILPEDKIGPYLAEAERRGLLAAFYLELTTGLRRGELLALLWTDLDVENMTISVSKQVNRINGELVVSQPKTPNSVRKLAIPQRAVELLVEEHAKHPHSPYLFVSPKTGTMFDPDSFRHTHEKILKAIGAEHIRFHDLRHPYVKSTTKKYLFFLVPTFQLS